LLPLATVLPGAAATADVNESASPDLARRISVGGLHTCAILDTGGVSCWGSNDTGQLGNGTRITNNFPVSVAINGIVQLAAGGSHTCALRHGGTVWCWGLNGSGQLGDESLLDKLGPAQVHNVTGAVAVASGGFHSCAIIAGGTVKCWGNDGMGQIGDASPGDTSSNPTLVSGLSNAKSLALGEFHSCALLTDNTVKCWGHNGFGQLGNGFFVDSSAPVAVGGLPDDVLAITAGSSHTCALLDDTDKTVRCWGHNAYGSLGQATAVQPPPPEPGGAMVPSATPLTVRFDNDPDPLIEDLVPLKNVNALSAGAFHTCARVGAGALWCWGNNNRGQLGADPNPLTPRLEDGVSAVQVGGLGGNAGAVTVGGFHSCALVGTTMKCWGYNFNGQLGRYRTSSHVPVVVTALTGATTVSAGTDFACAIVSLLGDETKPAGQPYCWGSNTDGRLGSGTGITDTTIRVPVAGGGVASSLDAGNGHACFVPDPPTGGTPRCWGLGGDGQLGNGATANQPTPVNAGLSNAVRLSAGGASDGAERGTTCAVRSDSKVSCWGRNDAGQLGNDSTSDSSSPVTVKFDSDPDPSSTVLVDLSGVDAVATGGRHACALLTGQTVMCWGANGSGQLGDGSNTQRHIATPVSGLSSVTAIVAGVAHTCARLSNDTVKCWGANGSGQLGDGTNDPRNVPTAVPFFTGGGNEFQAKVIGAGDLHTCASRGDGGLSCWGENGSGQLGNNSILDSPQPKQAMAPVEDEDGHPVLVVTAVSGGRRNTCARLIDFSVSCWGDNSRGQLGDGVGPFTLTPDAVVNLPALGTNHIPSPVDDVVTTTPGTPVTISVLANDTDLDGDTLTLVGVGPAQDGTAVNNGNGTVTYTPNAGFCGDDTFTYTVSDGIAAVEANVRVEMNCPPIAANDAATTSEEAAVTIGVLANDSDPDGDTLTVTAVSDPPRGTATFTATDVTYTPDTNVCGPPADIFTYTISDGHGHTATGAVTVTISCANDAPVAVDDAAATPEDTAVTVQVLANDTDPDGDTLTLTTVGAASHGSAVLNGAAVTYTPNAGYCGPDTFTYTASDSALTDTATVTIAVTCVADSPSAVDDVLTVAEDTLGSVNVVANDSDPDGDSLTVTAVSDPPHGTTTNNGDGTIGYQGDQNYCGGDTFSYTVSDGALTDTATVTVTVTCVNDAPVAVDDSATTPEDTNIHIHVRSNDSDPDGDNLTVVSVTDPPHGTAAIAADAATYTPDANFCGNDTFDYTVRDPSGATAVGHVFVTVTCVNDAPIISAVAAVTTTWGTPVNIALTATDADASDTATFSLVSGPAGAAVIGTAFTWTPTSAQVGVHPVKVRVTDGAGAFSETTFTVTVNRRPTAIVYSGATSGQYSDPVNVVATLTDTLSGAGVAGRSVSFTLGALTASATTTGVGTAATSMLLLGPTGPATMATAFAGDAAYLPSGDTDAFTVAKEAVVARFTGTHVSPAGPVTLSASLDEDADGFLGSALSTATVTFATLGGPNLCTASVSVTGPGSGTATCATAALPLGSRTVTVTIGGPAYTALVDVSAITVAAPDNGDGAGSGQIGLGDDFAFSAKAAKKGAPTGDAVHVFVSGATAYVVSAATLASLARSCTGGSPKVCSVTVQASGATVTAVDLTTGVATAVPGTATIRVDATDDAPDRYAVAITGAVTYSLGSPGSQVTLTAGEVRVPS